MPKYEVVGYYTMPVVVKVEAENKEEAYDKGYDLLRYEGHGTELDGDWQDEFYVEEIDG